VKGDAISLLTDLFPRKCHDIKIIPTTENEIKCIIHFLKTKYSLGSDGRITTQKIFLKKLKISVVSPLYKKGDNTIVLYQTIGPFHY
jgi:hypothetical protein